MLMLIILSFISTVHPLNLRVKVVVGLQRDLNAFGKICNLLESCGVAKCLKPGNSIQRTQHSFLDVRVAVGRGAVAGRFN